MLDRGQRGKKAEADGRRAELWAMLMLCLHGYVPLARRWRSPAGEIDLIAARPFGPVCFIEVKRRASPEAAVVAVTTAQRQRICRSAQIFLKSYPHHHGVRFDVISVEPGRLPRHIRDAFRPDAP